MTKNVTVGKRRALKVWVFFVCDCHHYRVHQEGGWLSHQSHSAMQIYQKGILEMELTVDSIRDQHFKILCGTQGLG